MFASLSLMASLLAISSRASMSARARLSWSSPRRCDVGGTRGRAFGGDLGRGWEAANAYGGGVEEARGGERGGGDGEEKNEVGLAFLVRGSLARRLALISSARFCSSSSLVTLTEVDGERAQGGWPPAVEREGESVQRAEGAGGCGGGRRSQREGERGGGFRTETGRHRQI